MKNKPLASLVTAMTVFGTTGIVSSQISLPSGFIAFSRSITALVFLMIITFVSKHSLSVNSIKANRYKLLISGAALGINWVMLFEAIKHTGVAVATVCYYLAPIIVIAISPFVFKEIISVNMILCITVAVIGIVFVTGVFDVVSIINPIGVIFGIAAAVCYAVCVIVNKSMIEISPLDRTIVQFAVAVVILFLYTFSFEKVYLESLSFSNIILLVVLGLVHTGIAYVLYFYALNNLPSQTVSLFSYIDPVVAVILSGLMLGEAMSVFQIIGSVLVIFSTLIFEIKNKKVGS
ncbi:MAG: EamA family transporter [Clostridia bacterium]|nr:EamA family transporter [Clostridia bacterium]